MTAEFFVKISTYFVLIFAGLNFCQTQFFCYYFNLNLENGGIFLKIENYNLSWKESAMIRSRRKTSLAKTGKQSWTSFQKLTTIYRKIGKVAAFHTDSL